MEVQACVTRGILRLTKSLATVDASHRPWDAALKKELEADLAKTPLLSVTSQSDRRLRPPPAGFSMSLPGVLVMFVLQMVLIYGGTALVHDRIHGQFVRLMAAPVSANEVFLGKVLGRLVLATLQAGILLGGGALLFHLPLGDHPWYLAAVILSFGCFAASFSLLGGLAFRTEKQVVQMAIFSSMVLSALGGSWWPIEIVPPIFKTIATFTPTYWGIHGIQSVMYFNHGSQVLLRECPILLGFAGVSLLAAIPLARRLARG
jgi:ABC-2 type transport system permease protein